MSLLHIVLAALLLLGPLIAIHEFGHFWVARRLGVKVLVFSIGFGPALLRRTGRDGVVYQFSAIPLGGYVRMADEREGEVAPEDLPHAFNRQSPWRRMAIVAAGPLINLLLAVLLFWGLFMLPSEQLSSRIGRVDAGSVAAQAGLQPGQVIVQVDGEKTQRWEQVNLAFMQRMGESGQLRIATQTPGQPLQEYRLPVRDFLKTTGQSPVDALGLYPWQPKIAPVVGSVAPGSAAARQGLQVGDRILAINGQPVQDWLSLSQRVRREPEQLLSIRVARGAQVLELAVMPQGHRDALGQRVGQLGVGPKVDSAQLQVPAAYRTTVQYGPVEALTQAVHKTGQMSWMTLQGMVKMVRGLIGLDNLSGPITIAKIAGHTASIGWRTFLDFMALMSISLGVLNLLPIPVLDGGHLLYYLAEGLRGKPLSERVQQWGFKLGVGLLGTMMLIALFNDFSRLF